MKHTAFLLAAVLVATSAHPVWAADVELPPPPKLRSTPPKHFWDGNTRYPTYVIQTSAGRVECPRTWYEPSACRPYRPGTDRRPRAFVRKEGTAWMICPLPSGRSGCVGIRDLPNFVEQE